MELDANAGERDGRFRTAIAALALDAATAEVLTALRMVEVRPIVLKGPVIARWLYRGGEHVRGYVDIDLLVAPEDRPAAAGFLEREFSLSLKEVALPAGRRPHAETWVRARDGVTVDLHHTLPGSHADDSVVWASLYRHAENATVGGAEVLVLDEAARALIVTLHASHHGVSDDQAMSDLRRALGAASDDCWSGAAAIARALDATQAFSAGLRLLPEGAELATELGIPWPTLVETHLRASSAPELALSLDWLVHAPNFRTRVRLVLRRLFPSPGVLRARSRLAQRTPLGLVAAYVAQPLLLAWNAPGALWAWLSARRAAASVHDPE